MKQFFTFVFGILFSVSLLGQHNAQRCGTMEHLAYQKHNDPALLARMNSLEKQTQKYIHNNSNSNPKSVIVVPVVIHVLWSSSAQNISDAQIYSQIDVLNEDFRKLNADTTNTPALFKGVAADCEVEFCLAKQDPQGHYTTGITRTQTNKAVFELGDDDAKFDSLGGHDIWDRDKYLNIWVVPAIKDGSSTGILGYSQFPGGAAATDGVVIQYRNFGRIGNLSPYYDKGRTVTHEIGHWFNLYHIWGDDGIGCWGTDYVNDTPNQADETYGCPTFPQQSCSNTSDMFSNYMDYSDDVCMNIFTEGQKARIWATLTGFRIPLTTSSGCIPVGITENLNLSNIEIYPNPNHGEFHISFGDLFIGKIIITNNLGQIVLIQNIKNQREINLRMSEVGTGIYFITIFSDKKTIVRKLQIL